MSAKTVIIGGVAGGASAAARLRRLDEEAEIVLLERGEHISYANCGLPYYIGEVIRDREKLFIMTPMKFKEWFNVDVRVLSEALSLDREGKRVEVKDLRTGEQYRESYDHLILSPGAAPIRPSLPGIDHPAIYTLRSVADTDRIYNFILKRQPRTAVVIGGGFIGLEMAENLRARGLTVTVAEMAPWILPNLDREMAALVQQYLRAEGIDLRLGDGMAGFREGGNGSVVVTLQSGTELPADLVLLAIGVKPEMGLAREAGLETGKGIVVNEYLQTSDPHIYALGDAVEVKELITGRQVVIPLAGPANKQGRIAANNIAGRREKYRGTQGTAVLKVFDLVVASTGAGERSLKETGLDYRQCIVQPNSHAGYYPGGRPMVLKLLFSPEGKIFGAQAAGYGGVDKRIDVISAAIRAGLNVYDLQALELAYAPPFSSAKDPVNMAGYVAGNILQGDVVTVECGDLLERVNRDPEMQLVDVREPGEFALGHIDGAVNIPLGTLRHRLGELMPERETFLYCSVGLRSYLASRILMQKGFGRVSSLNGGYRIYRVLEEEKNMKMPGGSEEGNRVTMQKNSLSDRETPVKLDCCGLQCPGPISQVFRKMEEIPQGGLLEVCATDPGFFADIASWCRRTGNTLISKDQDEKSFTVLIRKGRDPAGDAVSPDGGPAPAGKTIVVFSGDLDRAIAAFIIANGAAAMGRKVTLFFTFWGLNILRKSERVKVRKPFMDRMFGAMMPRGSKKLGLSRMNMMGMGPKMIRRVMTGKKVDSLEALMEQALSLGVRLAACQMSMEVMGITREELIDGIEAVGVASYLDAAEDSNINLFI